MDYIHSLKAEVERKEAALVGGLDELDWLLTYLASSKFRCGDRLDGYVNVQDVRDSAYRLRSLLAQGR